MKCRWCGQKIRGSYAVKQRTWGLLTKVQLFSPDIGKIPYFRRKFYYHKRCMDGIILNMNLSRALKSLYLPKIFAELAEKQEILEKPIRGAHPAITGVRYLRRDDP